MSNPLKPLLASNVTDFSKLKFPCYVSPKLDGVRATVYGGVLYSRSLKPIPNKFIQEKFGTLPDGTDGELIVGEPNQDPYRRTVSIVMSDDKPLDFYHGMPTRFFVFDNSVLTTSFFERYATIEKLVNRDSVRVVPHNICVCLEDLEAAEAMFLEAGYEGLMYRDPDGRYKHGRSSEREQILLKVKRFKDAEAVVLGCEPEMANNNESFTNELGRTARSSAKAGKVAKETLGKLNARGLGGDYDTVQFDIAVSSLTHVERKKVWDDFLAGKVVGQIAVFKYFPTGGDTRPRHPIFKGWRDARDMSNG